MQGEYSPFFNFNEIRGLNLAITYLAKRSQRKASLSAAEIESWKWHWLHNNETKREAIKGDYNPERDK